MLPRVYAIMHHGGSGTTHLAMTHGCASLIIPHIIDQFAWNRILADLGVGPLGKKINKLSVRTLEPKILELLNNPAFKEKAAEIQAQMAGENLKVELINKIID